MNFRTCTDIILECGFGISYGAEPMNEIELERGTKEFSLKLIKFLESLPKNYLGEAMGRQNFQRTPVMLNPNFRFSKFEFPNSTWYKSEP